MDILGRLTEVPYFSINRLSPITHSRHEPRLHNLLSKVTYPPPYPGSDVTVYSSLSWWTRSVLFRVTRTQKSAYLLHNINNTHFSGALCPSNTLLIALYEHLLDVCISGTVFSFLSFACLSLWFGSPSSPPVIHTLATWLITLTLYLRVSLVCVYMFISIKIN